MRRVVLAFTALAISSGPSLAQSRVTQIETHPTYGATVTMEEGVRVFRPLPAQRHVIINPNRTPLMLDVGDQTTNTINNTSTNVVVRRRGY